MINLIRKSNFLSVSIKNSFQIIVRVIIGVLNIKVIALIAGPSGFALIGQFQNFLQLSVNIAGAGVNNGIIKLISETNNNKEKNCMIINTSFTILVISGIILSCIILFFSQSLSEFLFDSLKYKYIIAGTGIYILTTALFTQMLSVINGLQKLRLFIRLNILFFVSSFTFFAIFLYFFGITSALCSIIFQSFIALTVCMYYINKLGYWPRLTISKSTLKRLSKFSLMAILAGIITPLTIILVRKAIIYHLTVYDAGIWDGIFKLSTTYIGLATLPFSYYFLPTFSKTLGNKQLRIEVTQALIVLIPLLTLCGFITYLLREPLINILLSKEFNSAYSIIKWQILGDGFRVICWLFGMYLIAKEKVWTYIITELTSGILFLALTQWLTPIYGIEGSCIAYFVENIITTLVLIIIFLQSTRK